MEEDDSMTPTSIALIAIFLGTLLFILTEKADKSIVALAGGLLTFVILSYHFNFNFNVVFRKVIDEFIDFPTLIIMFGVLVVGVVVNESGLFQWVAIKIVKLTRGSPQKLLFLLILLTILLSSLLTILAAVIILGRLTISITKALDIDPKPYLLSEAVAVSIGGLTSLIASPASILIAQKVDLDYMFFIIHTLPFAIILAIIVSFVLTKTVELPEKITELRRMVIMEFDEWSVVPNKFLFYASLIILIGMVVGFFLFPAYIVAFTGAILFLIIHGTSFEKIAKEIEWSDILFFIGIFIIVGGVEYTGILEAIGHILAEVSGGNPMVPLLIIIWFTGIASGFLDEVTIALTFLPIINELVYTAGFLEHYHIFIIALILSTNLGGCMTPIGTPANLMILSIAEKEGKSISFKTFLKYGSLVVFINLIIASAYITFLLALL